MKTGSMVKFLLYVAGNTQNSALATVHLQAICREHLPHRHHIELVDVFKEPKRALADRIFLTPTLIRLAPAPVVRITGSLSQTDKVLAALGLVAAPT